MWKSRDSQGRSTYLIFLVCHVTDASVQVKVGSVPFFGSVPFLLKVTSPNFVLSTFILTLFKGSQKK